MGFLDHSTNNIIIDACLTDKGRETLARNNGTFRIVHYGFGDDEVDYTLIKKFGRTVGKEKIEKNTPVFEAQTIGSLGLKYPLITLSDPTLTIFPILGLSSDSTTTISNVAGENTATVTVNQSVPATTSTSVQGLLRETMYKVTLDARFLQLRGANTTPRTVPFSSTVIYDLAATSSGTGDRLSSLLLNLGIVSSGGQLPQFQDSNKLVRTFITVTGVLTGVTKTIEMAVQY